MLGWQWHQVDDMQIICTSLQTDNHASTSPLSFYRPDALPAAQPTASKHRRHNEWLINELIIATAPECLLYVDDVNCTELVPVRPTATSAQCLITHPSQSAAWQ